MKRLLLVFMVALGIVNQIRPMTAFQPKVDISQQQKIKLCNFFAEEFIQVPVVIYSPFDTNGIPVTGKVKGREGVAENTVKKMNKPVIKNWCDNFKSNSQAISKFEASIPAHSVCYVITCKDGEIITTGNYNKILKAGNEGIEEQNRVDNDAYIDALVQLKQCKFHLESDLSNVSWFQWLWNYRAYKNYQKSIQTLDEEIALFKDQDQVVSKEKTVFRRDYSNLFTGYLLNSDNPDIIINPDKKVYVKDSYKKPQLTIREVFTRSRMPRSRFEEVKRNRE